MSCILLGLLFYGFEIMRGVPPAKKNHQILLSKNASLFIFVVWGGNSFHSWKFHSLSIHLGIDLE
jgi:hypothetical protein